MLNHTTQRESVLKDQFWVASSHSTLGKQTGLSRPLGAALCEAAMLAQVTVRCT